MGNKLNKHHSYVVSGDKSSGHKTGKSQGRDRRGSGGSDSLNYSGSYLTVAGVDNVTKLSLI